VRAAKTKPCRPVTAEERRIILQLSGCRFLPGTWDKRVVAALVGALAASDRQDDPLEITEAQAAILPRLAHRYRRQINPRKWGRDGRERSGEEWS
jgi:hypothetical protein